MLSDVLGPVEANSGVVRELPPRWVVVVLVYRERSVSIRACPVADVGRQFSRVDAWRPHRDHLYFATAAVVVLMSVYSVVMYHIHVVRVNEVLEGSDVRLGVIVGKHVAKIDVFRHLIWALRVQVIYTRIHIVAIRALSVTSGLAYPAPCTQIKLLHAGSSDDFGQWISC